jgi:hypothetical protein
MADRIAEGCASSRGTGRVVHRNAQPGLLKLIYQHIERSISAYGQSNNIRQRGRGTNDCEIRRTCNAQMQMGWRGGVFARLKLVDS